ncbi:MAG TPA: hypothetical protein VEN29_02575 [Casimicrobiaceae bacterium]|nr:hypothetical protein [Casimicrobiaceae bacterium]
MPEDVKHRPIGGAIEPRDAGFYCRYVDLCRQAGVEPNSPQRVRELVENWNPILRGEQLKLTRDQRIVDGAGNGPTVPVALSVASERHPVREPIGLVVTDSEVTGAGIRVTTPNVCSIE